jgi:hypothetical protein
MKELALSTKAPKVNKECTITVMRPETATEAIQVCGDEAVVSNAIRNWIVTLQAGIRRALEKGLSQDEIQAKFKDAKMGVAVLVGGGIVDPVQAALAKAATMTPEELAMFIKQLKQSAQGQPAAAA